MNRRNFYTLIFLSFVALCTQITFSHEGDELLEAGSTLFSQEHLKRAYQHLDEVDVVLQYMGQIINRNVIKFPQRRIGNKPTPTKAEAIEWVFKTQKIVKDLKFSDEHSNEQALLKITRTTKALIMHLSDVMTDNFKNLIEFEQPVILPLRVQNPLTPEGQAEVHTYFEDQLSTNEQIINGLHTQSKTLGLTKTNLWARRVDAFNDKYKITNILQQVPRYAGLAGLGIYLVPFRYCAGIRGLEWVKRKIGTPDYYDPDGSTIIEDQLSSEEFAQRIPAIALAQHNSRTISGFFNSKEYKGVYNITKLATMMYAQDLFGQAFAPVRGAFRSYWNKLKGFDVPNASDLKYPDMTLDDKRLIGLETQIEDMWNIVHYITEPEQYDRAGIGLEKGILLTGPSRSGKTMLAQATCGTLNAELRKKGITKKFAFKTVNANEFRWTPESIKSVIQDAKLNAPCIIFIDELHLLPLQTKEGGNMLNDFLTMTESLRSTDIGDAVIVLAATNRAYMLDEALLKPGRFGIKIHFEEPTFEKRKRYFTEMCHYYTIDQSDIDCDTLTRQTEGCSYGDLDLIFKNASFTARSLHRSIKQDDFQQNIYKQFYRLRFDKKLPLTPEARRRIAVHQAGHALMYALQENELNEVLEVVTLHGKWNKIVETRFFDPKMRKEQSKKPIKFGHIQKSHKSEFVMIDTNPVLSAQIKLAGAIAEDIILGSINYSYHEKDKRKALDFLEKIAFNGLKKEDFSPDELKEPMMKAKADLKKCEEDVRTLLIQHKADLEKIALELEKRELLTGSDLKKLITPAQLQG